MSVTYMQDGSASLTVGPSSAVPPHLRGRVMDVSAVHVEPEDRRQGHATALLRMVCADADLSGFVLLLSPEPEDDGMPIDALAAWYSRLGFVTIQDEPMLMARAPRQASRGMH